MRLIVLLLFVSVSAQAQCERIVSLAPSVTETLVALGLGDRLVGVSRYDKYPESVRSLTKVGGLLDPNIEAVISLQPSAVIGLREQTEVLARIQSLKLHTLMVVHDTVSSILNSINIIGKFCNTEKLSRELHNKLTAEIKVIRNEAVRNSPRVLVIVIGQGGLNDLFISGIDGFYSQLLEIAGGENVFPEKTGALLSVSQESFLSLKPSLIFLINTDSLSFSEPELSSLAAKFGSHQDRVRLFSADYASVPGPRLVSLLREFLNVLKEDANGTA